jgi:Domain of unknown function (DUF4398)
MKVATLIFLPTRLRRAVVLPLVLLAASCASTPPAPTAALQSAQQAIASAESADAGHYAPGELGEARARLASANTAMVGKHMLVATRLAEQSQAEAELASAKTSALKAGGVNAELTQGNSNLIEELDRSAGDKK